MLKGKKIRRLVQMTEVRIISTNCWKQFWISENSRNQWL